MWVFFLHVCMCTVCVSGACGVQKRVLDPLGLELQMVVSNHAGRCRELNSGPLRSNKCS